MILLCDEDIGRRVPQALRLVGHKVHSLTSKQWRGTQDIKWLANAGQQGWLVFSCNKHQLEVEVERETIIQENVGVVYLTNGQENLHNVLRLLLNKWEWLKLVDQTIPRPFAFFLSPNGRVQNKSRLLKMGSS